ncbi:MAG TPA: DUF192 domain-containing protein [Polyangia bacterium]|jgi:hypothetical protein|nr:DUF192 domain-containing protein [Polyangia bacterium]
MHRLLCITWVALAAAGGGCSHSSSSRAVAHPTPEVVFYPEGAPEVRVVVEVARRESERNRGLMFRDHLEPGRGMLFLFERPQPLSFWMRNTYIPLDMIFLGADRRVVGLVERAEPLTDNPRRIEGDSQFVVEVPGGWAAAHRIAPGVRAQFFNVE